MELQQKFGQNFQKIHELDLDTATPLDRKMHNFINRIQKSALLHDTITLHDSEVVASEADAAQENKTKPNMQKIVQASYNWNPYHERSTKNNSDMQHDRLDVIPDEFRQAGWGMQPQAITGSPQTYRYFPNTDVLKNMMADGQRMTEMGHLLTNPLRELGHRDADISSGRDYNVMERVLSPYASNVIEEWHGLAPINSQNESFPPPQKSDKQAKTEAFLTKQQLLMRRLKQRAIDAYDLESTMPPYKFGFEDVPVFVYRSNHHSPDTLGAAKRTRELVCKAFVLMKYVYPNMSAEQATALRLIGGRSYNEKTTKLKLHCTNHYFYEDNQAQIIEWIGRFIAEVDRFADYLQRSSGSQSDDTTWEHYQQLHATEFTQDRIYRRWNKYRWRQKMQSLPVHLRGNYNLYQSGDRMRKVTRYLDLMYDDAFVDAANILQREGPRKHCATDYVRYYVPQKYQFFDDVDALPAKPSEYILQSSEIDERAELQTVKHRFNIVSIDDIRKKRHSFGVNSCYNIPSSDAQFDQIENAFHMPLAQPFTGLRLRKHKITPWTNAAMMQLYRYGTKKVAMKLVFGDEQFKIATLKKTQAIEEERSKQKVKAKHAAASQGRRRDRKKYQAKLFAIEQKRLRKKRFQEKEAREAEDNPFFNYLGSKKISKQFSMSQLTDLTSS
eukprot:CAMPEP_0202692676 /NCGR_PEP_ID=MMETSP1385-20130828/6994_1 /ASSEMBLY_ACC=CAM_ASM_000861 /TAXON_ID=933848 /ORGANISM="Elphidium margaritaceum" /LENGTH=668 /DNA_ID=CAMNT_0049348253 /DNA_START=133 /DNA_END=2139 /DNA_ORIENTATION=+